MLNIKWIGSPNYDIGRGNETVHGIVYHITQSGTMPDYWFTTGSQLAGNPVSAHFAIDQEGNIHQYVRIQNTAWHAGYIDRPDMSNQMIANCINAGINPNKRLVGIEHVGYPGQPITWQQYQASVELSVMVWRSFPFNRDVTHMIRHSQINRGHNCPGGSIDINRIIRSVSTAI